MTTYLMTEMTTVSKPNADQWNQRTETAPLAYPVSPSHQGAPQSVI